jgi:hypothetical protein
MKGAAFLLIALLFLAMMPVLVRCAGILDEQGSLDDINNPSQSYKRELTGGTALDINIDGVSRSGSIDFHIFNSTDGQLLDKTNIGTEGYQTHWDVPYNDNFEFLVELTSGDMTEYHLTVTSTGTDNPQQGGGFDAAPIGAAVIVLLIWFVSVFLILRNRKEQPPPPPPT